MSTVYLAIQISVGRVVALKVMSPTLNGDPSFSERFQREANIVGQLSHPNIVSIYDIGKYKNLNYIAMDYLPGGSVHERMMTGLAAEDALRVTREIASALDHAHEKGYIHRDIKPENILFRADNSAVLSDFGVAKGILGASRMTNVGQVVGTPHYMSPEQTRGKPVDACADLYSLGVVFYEMLTGTVPFNGDNAVTIAIKHLSAPIPRLPMQYQAYQKLIDKLLDKNPEKRFQSGREVVSAIEALESTGRSGFVTASDPSDLSALALLKALLGATSDALRRRLDTLIRTRWTPKQGIYLQPQTRITEILLGNIEDSRVTAISTNLHETAEHHILQAAQKKWSRYKVVIGVAALMMFIFSVSIFSGDDDDRKDASKNTATQTVVKKAAPSSSEENSSATSSETTTATTTTSEQLVQQNNTAQNISSESNSSVAANAPAPVETQPETLVTNNPALDTPELNELPEKSPQARPETFALKVKTTPHNARIRILNIVDRYRDGIQLTPGAYHLEISHAGYRTMTEWVKISDQDIELVYALEKSSEQNKKLVSNLGNNKKGPEMVSIPAGTFIMGNSIERDSAPTHTIQIRKSFAISKYEITFDEYDLFVKATDRALPGDNRWGRKNRPVINVSWEDAQAYTEWLSENTGKRYRLPTESEWEYVARARSTTLFWWGNDPRDANERANCRRGCYSSFSGLFGSKTAPVGTYRANDFGVYDTAGNVAEWVQDCYVDNYNNKPKNGDAFEAVNCEKRVARGGSSKNNVDQIASHSREGYAPGIYDENIGFRVVMELE